MRAFFTGLLTATFAMAIPAVAGPASAAEAAGKPDCPDYVEQNRDWVQFAFTDGEEGASWSKTATMTQQAPGTREEALASAKRLQICFQAPYSFPTRPGYRLAANEGWYTGVLPDCTGKRNPCLVGRGVAEISDGWHAQLTFLVPPSAEDPKALG